jgi:hypothetical protein
MATIHPRERVRERRTAAMEGENDMPGIRFFALTAVVAVLLGCSGSRSGDSSQAPRRQANLITTEEIQAARSTQHAYDLIRMLRPQWLQQRGVQSLGSPVEMRPGERQPTQAGIAVKVYLDGSRVGGVEVLRNVLASDVLSAQYLGGPEAASRFGTDHGGGAILITSRRR